MTAVEAMADPQVSAEAVGLSYVSDERPGICRKKNGKTFRYLDASGKVISDKEELGRIKSLVVPPAWREVWICSKKNGHLQAVGRDAKGRKQYRYHKRWREIRDETKYTRMLLFAKALPKIRQRIKRDLKEPELSRHNILATVVRLLEVSLIRVGNEEYAKENGSFGLTTMRNRHVDVKGARVRFRFKGKSGKMHDIDVTDPRLARIIRKCQDLPGQELFQYLDSDGNIQKIDSDDINTYLREITGKDFTAKDFRTWAGTVLAAMALQEFEQSTSQKQAKQNVTQAIEIVAKRLGNTPTICRKCYVHPAILDCYLDGTMIESLKQRARTQMRISLHKLRPEEAAVLALLEHRLSQEKTSLETLLKKSITHRRRKKEKQKIMARN